jgi:hypothetical protein
MQQRARVGVDARGIEAKFYAAVSLIREPTHSRTPQRFRWMQLLSGSGYIKRNTRCLLFDVESERWLVRRP